MKPQRRLRGGSGWKWLSSSGRRRAVKMTSRDCEGAPRLLVCQPMMYSSILCRSWTICVVVQGDILTEMPEKILEHRFADVAIPRVHVRAWQMISASSATMNMLRLRRNPAARTKTKSDANTHLEHTVSRHNQCKAAMIDIRRCMTFWKYHQNQQQSTIQ